MQSAGSNPSNEREPLLGPTLGGWITYKWTWRWCFYRNLPLGFCAVLMVIAFVHDTEYRKSQAAARKIDFLGIIYLVLGLGLLQIVSDRGQRADWFAVWWVCIFTVVAASSPVLLIVRELHFPEPIFEHSEDPVSSTFRFP
jgi:MFS transporter, DHA2 family, multidrug resistance protein